MNPRSVARHAPSTNTAARAIPAAPTRRATRRRGDPFPTLVACPHPRCQDSDSLRWEPSTDGTATAMYEVFFRADLVEGRPGHKTEVARVPAA